MATEAFQIVEVDGIIDGDQHTFRPYKRSTARLAESSRRRQFYLAVVAAVDRA